MSYLDKKFGLTFPTRNGAPTGGANERVMLDRTGGSAGFKKDYLIEADGSVTMLTTKNGNPQFTKLQDSGYGGTSTTATLYMETGQLSWNYPAPESPDKYDPATWHFMDIGTGESYLGRVSFDGVQHNTPSLSESQDSRAIGVSDANKAEYGPSTVMKKMVAATFPASLFSGKMRLFMQAQYGAAEKLYPALELDLLGTSPVLMYRDSVSGLGLQFGFWSHSTVGLLSGTDGSYWILTITQDSANVVVTSYPLRSTGLEKLKAKIAASSGADKTKAEAYLFANSTIDVSKAVIVGTHPLVAGDAMAYGWKFSESGGYASIVMNEVINTSTPLTTRYYSRTVNFTFGVAAGVVTMTGATVNNGEWIDGWGEWNIFVPQVSTAALVLYSLRVGGGIPPPIFNFANIPVYGYYVGETFTQVKISCSGSKANSYVHTSSGIRWHTGYAFNPSALWGGDGFMNGSKTPVSYSRTYVSNASGMDVDVGGIQAEGMYGDADYFSLEGHSTDDYVCASGDIIYPDYLENMDYFEGTPPSGYLASQAFRVGGAKFGVANIEYTTTNVVGVGAYHKTWTLVIPSGDCEAAYVATYDYVSIPSATTQAGTGLVIAGSQAGKSSIPYGPIDIFGPFAEGWKAPFHSGELLLVLVGSSPLTISGEYKVKCFNSALSGVEGTPGGSYYALFNVSYLYPYYDRGMYTYTSFGKRYIMSEGLISPASAVYGRAFVGWA